MIRKFLVTCVVFIVIMNKVTQVIGVSKQISVGEFTEERSFLGRLPCFVKYHQEYRNNSDEVVSSFLETIVADRDQNYTT